MFNPKEYKLLSFDIYGTLIDWETGLYTSLLPLLSKLPASHSNHPSHRSEAENRAFILNAYVQLELAIQKENPTLAYPAVLSSVYTRLAEQFNIAITGTEAEEFGKKIGTWPAFPDTVAAMQVLAKHYKLVVLSNVDRVSFSQTLSGPLSGVKFDAIYTAQDIGSYKPDLRNFEYMTREAKREFGVEKSEVLKVAQSLVHDHVPAMEFGLRPSVWIERRPGGAEARMGGKLEELKESVQLAATFPTLGDFAEAVEKGFEG
jgi:2-haloalkanoic acid dehalogenase type II